MRVYVCVCMSICMYGIIYIFRACMCIRIDVYENLCVRVCVCACGCATVSTCVRAQEPPMALVKVWRGERPPPDAGPPAALRTLSRASALLMGVRDGPVSWREEMSCYDCSGG